MRSKLDVRRSLLLAASALLVVALLVGGCREDAPLAPSNQQTASIEEYGLNHPEVMSLIQIQERHSKPLMADPNVVGTAIGLDDNGRLAITLYLADDVGKAGNNLPFELEGAPVHQVVSGRIVARGGMGGGGSPGGGGGSCSDNPKAMQSGAVKMGTSGGWRYDLANGYCCGGTLGSLIQSGNTKYVLSNYHVLYSDTTPGGNSRTAQPGDPVIHPGLIDVGCNANSARNIATLVANGGSLPGANIDAGIAAVIGGEVDETGAILCVGVPSSNTVSAFINQGVKKMGRTTGLGRGTVTGLNANINITYADECAGGTDFTKSYSGQIIISNSRCAFLDGGDSGSLMVEDEDISPNPVGLLFAGSVNCNRQAIAIANPIGDVLNHYNASMVGN
jgi:hypothetical protein